MSKAKTNNSYLDIKQSFRELNIKELKEKKVLDAFCGNSEIWKNINTDLYIGINKEKTKKVNLKGDNRKYLSIMNLENYNIIDLDAYGIPFDQLELVFKNKTLQSGTIIFFTFIQSIFGKMPIKLLKLYGYKSEMIKKIPTLFDKKGFEIFKWYLADRGINEVYYIQIDNKIYGMFKILYRRKETL